MRRSKITGQELPLTRAAWIGRVADHDARRGMHNLRCALYPLAAKCAHSMGEIHLCVICLKGLRVDRKHVDTCGNTCFRTLCRLQVGRDA